MTEDELLTRLRCRDPNGLSALVDAHATPVYGLVHRILAGAGTEPDVEECVSDAFYAAWSRIDQYDPTRAPLRTWLLILAKYQALERRRALLKRAGKPVPADEEQLPDPLGDPEQALALFEERREVQAALDRLAPVDKDLVYRRYFLGQRVEEAAEALGLTRQAADNRLWRARKALREWLTIDSTEEAHQA